MKKTQFQLAFDDLFSIDIPDNLPEESKGDFGSQTGKTTIEFLPCLFQKNVDESNKSVYFDSIIKEADEMHKPKHKIGSK